MTDQDMPIGQAYMVDYNSATNQFSNWASFSYINGADGSNFHTHFEGISSRKKGVYTLSADSFPTRRCDEPEPWLFGDVEGYNPRASLAELRLPRWRIMLITHLLVPTLLWSVIGWAEYQANDPSDALFSAAEIPRIHIQVEPEPLDKLKSDPRNYVKATIREDDRVAVVALKLKGAAGSFRDWDDRPALTLNMRKFNKGGTFHGLVKFHLNNSVQDETYLHELLCSELFRRAGIPAPRVTHARVWLNDRDVGLYVLKEGFDRPYLKRSFPDPTGNLYDGGFCQDINADLEKDEGSGPDDRSDLRAVVEAASDPDPTSRLRRVESLVDMDAFLTFMAMERMTCHWDGYTNTANNYRIYFDPRRGKAIFLPHGMDQMFADPEMGLFDPSDKIVAAVVLRSEALRRRYRERLEKLIPLMSPADGLVRRVDEIDRRLRPVIEAIDRDRANTARGAGRGTQAASRSRGRPVSAGRSPNRKKRCRNSTTGESRRWKAGSRHPSARKPFTRRWRRTRGRKPYRSGPEKARRAWRPGGAMSCWDRVSTRSRPMSGPIAWSSWMTRTAAASEWEYPESNATSISTARPQARR